MKQVEKQRNAYFGIRHLSPWTIRRIRFALDCDSNSLKLEKQLLRQAKAVPLVDQEMKDYFSRNIVNACRYMVANPNVGICCNFDGDDHWTWKEDEK